MVTRTKREPPACSGIPQLQAVVGQPLEGFPRLGLKLGLHRRHPWEDSQGFPSGLLHGAVIQASGVVYDPTGPLGIGCVLTLLPVQIQ